jgi:hypothetical protein
MKAVDGRRTMKQRRTSSGRWRARSASESRQARDGGRSPPRPLRDTLPLDQLRSPSSASASETLAKALEDRERLGWARLHICHVGGLLAEDLRPMADLAQDVWRSRGILASRMEATRTCGRMLAYALGEHRRAVDLLLKEADVRTVRQPGQPARMWGDPLPRHVSCRAR